jgi:hypothetical protein
MNHLETSKTEDLESTRPMFSSTWLALFTVLRRNYNERHHVFPVKPEHLQKVAKKHSDIKTPSV